MVYDEFCLQNFPLNELKGAGGRTIETVLVESAFCDEIISAVSTMTYSEFLVFQRTSRIDGKLQDPQTAESLWNVVGYFLADAHRS